MAMDKKKHDFGKHFAHPIFQSWNEILSQRCAHIYVKGGQLYTEHTVHGDSVGYVTNEVTTLAQSFKPSVWALELACGSPHWSIVFAPKDFDIRKFHQDLSLLFFLGTMAKLVNRRDFLKDWNEPAELLSPGMAWGEAQGWWHKDQNVMVACLARDGAQDLWNYLSRTFSISDGETVEIRNLSVFDSGLLKAMELLGSNIQQYPRN